MEPEFDWCLAQMKPKCCVLHKRKPRTGHQPTHPRGATYATKHVLPIIFLSRKLLGATEHMLPTTSLYRKPHGSRYLSQTTMRLNI